MLYSLLGSAVWRLFRVYVTGKPYDFLFENIDTMVAGMVGCAVAGYSVSRWEWREIEKEDEANASINQDTANSL